MNLNCIVKAGYISEQTGMFAQVCEQKNLVTYEGADILASLLSGDASARLTHMYFSYQNKPAIDPVTASVVLDRTMGRASFDAIDGGSPDYQDWLRVPIITSPRLFKTPSDATNYQANGLYLTATSAASESMSGESPAQNYFGASGSPDHGPSTVFSAALVSAPNPAFHSQDRVFSRVNLATPLTFVAGSQIAIFWSIGIS